MQENFCNINAFEIPAVFCIFQSVTLCMHKHKIYFLSVALLPVKDAMHKENVKKNSCKYFKIISRELKHTYV